MLSMALLIIVLMALISFFFGRFRAIAAVGGETASLHSRPAYHGFYSALCTAIAGLVMAIGLQLAFDKYIETQLYAALPESYASQPHLIQDRLIDDARALVRGAIVSNAADEAETAARQQVAAVFRHLSQLRDWSVIGLGLLAAGLAFGVSYRQIAPAFRARNRTEAIVRTFLMLAATVAVLTTIGILFSLIGETIRFFSHIPLWKFLFGTHWSPLSGVMEGSISPDTVGAIPLFAGTFLIMAIAMLVAVPVGLFAAIYLSDFASSHVRAVTKPLLEILAGIPTVVYGFFAAITVAPFIRQTGDAIGLDVAAQSALAAGLVMGIMLIPFISSLSDDVINAVPQSLRDGSYGLGATKSETITKVVLPAALPGIVSAIILAVSRAVGETMIVVMAAGQGANLTWNPLESVTTVTVQIVMLITGDTEASTAAGPAFALGFTLFVVTLILNVVAMRIVNRYREKYD